MPTLMKPNPLTSPGDGYIDGLAAGLAEEGEAVTDMSDDFADQLRPPCIDLLNATESARRLLFTGPDLFVKKIRAAEGLIRAIGDNAAASAQQIPGDNHQGFANTQAALRRSELGKVQTAVRAEVVSHFADLATKAGEDFGTAFSALVEAFQLAWTKSNAPAALTHGAKLEDLYRDQQILTELRSARLPCAEAFALVKELATVAAKNPGDDDARAMYETTARVCRTLAVEVRTSNPAKLNARYNARDEGMAEREMATRLLDFLEKMREKRRPQSLVVAGNLLDSSRTRSLMIFGSVPHAVCAAEFQIRGNPVSPKAIANAERLWEGGSGEWLQRFLPPSPDHLALAGLIGWSERIGKTASGIPVRRPRGG